MSSEDATFTPGDTKIIMCVIKHLRGQIDSDFEAVATELGYKNAQIAKTRLQQIIRKKINNGASVGGEKATPKKRKGAAAADDDGTTEESPAKKGRGRKPKAKAADKDDIKEETVEEENVEEENAVETTE
ncbi:hypothetical protein LTR27_003425 [Elasticomyces elasticus]|nr:hypothetical protein LTR27_003425 [Elasticomyces elasticus]